MISARIKGFPITVVNPADPSILVRYVRYMTGIAWHVLITKYIPPSHLHWEASSSAKVFDFLESQGYLTTLLILVVTKPFRTNMADSTGSGAGKQLALSVTYKSPANEDFSNSVPLATPPSDSVENRTKYLKDLRQAVVQTQEQVNKELTARMEEDNARATAAGTPGGNSAVAGVDEVKEEENYGEEVLEGED
jgi:hypothetical protein